MGSLASRRFRVRVAFGCVGLVVAGGVAAAVAIGNTAAPPLPRSNHKDSLQTVRPRVPLTAADRREIRDVARRFVVSAVERIHPERAWPIASESLRAGQTLQQWRAGSLPVEPYPVRVARWRFAYTVRGEVGLDVWVDATDPKLSPLVYRLTLVRGRRASRAVWLANSWTPVPLGGSFVSSPRRSDGGQGQDGVFSRASATSSRLWVLVPFGALLLAILIPLTAIASTRHRERRSRNAFRRRAV